VEACRASEEYFERQPGEPLCERKNPVHVPLLAENGQKRFVASLETPNIRRERMYCRFGVMISSGSRTRSCSLLDIEGRTTEVKNNTLRKIDRNGAQKRQSKTGGEEKEFISSRLGRRNQRLL